MFLTINEAKHFFTKRKQLGIKPGLERIQKLLQLLGSPEKKFPCIHVAGTNGKGSTIHFIASALRANGYKIGIFTSPSFHGLLGHIYLNDELISEGEFLSILNDMLPLINKLDAENAAPTEYEILTALAYVYFANHGSLALIETGLGGRYDMTNTCLPILSIITNVSLDHTDFLGNSLAEVARHKAGIIKAATPVIIGGMDIEAFQVIQEEAQQKNAELSLVSKESITKPIKLSMQGEHQVINAAVALRAIKALQETGYVIDLEKAKAAIENTSLPGRFEVLHEQPLVIADAAHNPAGVKAFLDTIATSNSSIEHILVAMFTDKDTKTMLHLLSEYFEKITVTTFDHPRAATIKELNRHNQAKEQRKIVQWQLEITQLLEAGEAFCITGSLHFITLVRAYFREIKQKL